MNQLVPILCELELISNRKFGKIILRHTITIEGKKYSIIQLFINNKEIKGDSYYFQYDDMIITKYNIIKITLLDKVRIPYIIKKDSIHIKNASKYFAIKEDLNELEVERNRIDWHTVQDLETLLLIDRILPSIEDAAELRNRYYHAETYLKDWPIKNLIQYYKVLQAVHKKGGLIENINELEVIRNTNITIKQIKDLENKLLLSKKVHKAICNIRFDWSHEYICDITKWSQSSLQKYYYILLQRMRKLNINESELTPKQKFFASKAIKKKIDALPPYTPTQPQQQIKNIDYYQVILNQTSMSQNNRNLAQNIINNVKRRGGLASAKEISILQQLRLGRIH